MNVSFSWELANQLRQPSPSFQCSVSDEEGWQVPLDKNYVIGDLFSEAMLFLSMFLMSLMTLVSKRRACIRSSPPTHTEVLNALLDVRMKTGTPWPPSCSFHLVQFSTHLVLSSLLQHWWCCHYWQCFPILINLFTLFIISCLLSSNLFILSHSKT